MDVLSAIELPHWLMIAGALLLVVGFIGLVFRKNRETEPQPASLESPPPQPEPTGKGLTPSDQLKAARASASAGGEIALEAKGK